MIFSRFARAPTLATVTDPREAFPVIGSHKSVKWVAARPHDLTVLHANRLGRLLPTLGNEDQPSDAQRRLIEWPPDLPSWPPGHAQWPPGH